MPDNDATGGAPDTSGTTTPPSGESTTPAAAPRPARRPPPAYVESTEKLSLTPIGGGAPQPPGAAVGAPPPAAAVPPPPGAPGVPPPLGGLAPVASGGAAPPAPAPAAPGGIPGLGAVGGGSGLAQVGGGAAAPLAGVGQGGVPAVPPPPGAPLVDPLAALNTHPDASNPYLNSGRPDLDRRPVAYAGATASGGGYVEPGSFDSGKAMMIGALVVGLGILAWLLSVVIVMPVPAPKDFREYSTASGAFSFDAPTDWSHKAQDTKRTDSVTGQDYQADDDGVTFWNGKAKVEIDTNSGGRSAQEVLLSGGGPTEVSLLDTEEKAFMDRMKKRVNGFSPQDAGGAVVAGFGAHVKEYTGKTGFLGLGGPIHGYAVTARGPKHVMTMYLECPEKSWKDLDPAFQRMMKSVKLDGLSAEDMERKMRDLFGGGGGSSVNIPGGGTINIPSGTQIPPGL